MGCTAVFPTEGPGSFLTTDDTDGTDNGCRQHTLGILLGRLKELFSRTLSVPSVSFADYFKRRATSAVSLCSAVVKIAFLSLLLSSVVHAGCGIGWEEPRSHFEGVDHQGYVMFTERLGEIDAGAKPGGEGDAAEPLLLPIYAIFNSNSGNNSPYAGVGWTVPLLESRMVQTDENAFRLDKPDGWFRSFYRDKKNPLTFSIAAIGKRRFGGIRSVPGPIAGRNWSIAGDALLRWNSRDASSTGFMTGRL